MLMSVIVMYRLYRTIVLGRLCCQLGSADHLAEQLCVVQVIRPMLLGPVQSRQLRKPILVIVITDGELPALPLRKGVAANWWQTCRRWRADL